ncbi:MAG: hypothetical protein RLZZ330_151 [Actinomycetota bacterium]
MENTKILVIEDDESVRGLLLEVLTISGFNVKCFESVEAVGSKITDFNPALVLCDINLPGASGFDFLKTIRKSGNQIPFIALTARNDKLDITQGLREGADDYIVKPFGIEELVLRIKAVLRRSRNAILSNVIQVGNLVLDYESHEVKVLNTQIEFSRTEFDLLQTLMQNSSKVVRKQVLMSEVWGFDFETSTSVLDTYISYLRKKIPATANVKISTVRGVGFKIEVAE